MKLTKVVHDKGLNDDLNRSVSTARTCDQAQDIRDMGLKAVFVIALREIALVERKDVLSRDLAIAGDGAHFATTDDIVKCLKMGLVGVVVGVEIEVLSFIVARIAERVGRRCGWVAAENSGLVVEDWAGASQGYDKRKGEDFRQRHRWRRCMNATWVMR